MVFEIEKIYISEEAEQYLEDTWEPKGLYSWDKAREGGYVILENGIAMDPGRVVEMIMAYHDLKEQVERTAHLQKLDKIGT